MAQHDDLRDCAIHHINGDPTDNNPANLRMVDLKTGKPATQEQINRYIDKALTSLKRRVEAE